MNEQKIYIPEDIDISNYIYEDKLENLSEELEQVLKEYFAEELNGTLDSKLIVPFNAVNCIKLQLLKKDC